MSLRHIREIVALLNAATSTPTELNHYGIMPADVLRIPEHYRLVPDAEYVAEQIPPWVPRNPLKCGVYFSPNNAHCAVVGDNGMFAFHFLLAKE
jgi:hypothetical protein